MIRTIAEIRPIGASLDGALVEPWWILVLVPAAAALLGVVVVAQGLHRRR